MVTLPRVQVAQILQVFMSIRVLLLNFGHMLANTLLGYLENRVDFTTEGGRVIRQTTNVMYAYICLSFC